MFLCIHDLVQVTEGRLRAAAMPPLAGAWVQVPRIVLDAPLVERGDVFWCLLDGGGDPELAYLRGAVGVVCDSRTIEPWPGTFSLWVHDAAASLDRLVEALRAGLLQVAPGRFSVEDAASDEAPVIAADYVVPFRAEKSALHPQELKVLQLYGSPGADIYARTCGHSAKGLAACQRRAA